MRVFIYRNLHQNMLSIRALEGTNKGRVISHSPFVVLSDVMFRVSEAGRQRVLKDKKKNVHAGVVGTLQPFDLQELTETSPVEPVGTMIYNPYYKESFYDKCTHKPQEQGQKYDLAEVTIGGATCYNYVR